LILKYIGKDRYEDSRFFLETDDLVDFVEEEATKILETKPDLFKKHVEEVADNGVIGRKRRGNI
jgi:hypothetical protein